MKRTCDEGVICILLRARPRLLETCTEAPDRLYEVFAHLDFGSDVVHFQKFETEDRSGETVQINAREVVWMMAPTHLIENDRQMVAEEGGLDG